MFNQDPSFPPDDGPSTPLGVAVNPQGTKIYVGDFHNSQIFVVDPGTNAIRNVINLNDGACPAGIATSSAGLAFVATGCPPVVLQIYDMDSDAFVAQSQVADGRSGVATAVNPAGTRVYLTEQGNDPALGSVVALDAGGGFLAKIPIGVCSEGISVTADGKKAYAASCSPGSVDVIDTNTNTVINSIPVGKSPIAFGQFITPTQGCQVKTTRWKQFDGFPGAPAPWASSPYDQSYRTISFPTPDKTPVSPGGDLLLTDGTNSCKITLSANQNNLNGLASFVATRCPGMNSFGPSADGNGGFYLSLYNTRCLTTLSSCPRFSTTLKLLTNPNQLASNILSPKTIQAEGCALTTLAMSLKFAMVDNIDFPLPPPLNLLSFDPGTLNDFMSNALAIPGGMFDNQGNVLFDDTVRIVALNNHKPSLQFDQTGSGLRSTKTPASTYQTLDNALCATNPHPVVVGVKMDKNGTPGHYVLVTGKLPNTTDGHAPGGQTQAQYEIEDPSTSIAGKNPCTQPCTLDHYLNNNQTDFIIRGFVKDPTGDASALNLTVDDTADILATDPTGLQTGFDPVTGDVFEKIPGSVYSRDSSDNNDTGIRDTGTAHSVLISTPAAGTYQITITGLALGSYTVLVRTYTSDGLLQSIDPISGISGAGSTSTFRIQFSPDVGTISQIARVATFQSALDDIANSLQLGMIDNDGIANSLSKKIDHAADSLGQDRTNVLNAFTNEVQAQAGKRITGLAIQVLLDDAQSLINQSQ